MMWSLLLSFALMATIVDAIPENIQALPVLASGSTRINDPTTKKRVSAYLDIAIFSTNAPYPTKAGFLNKEQCELLKLNYALYQWDAFWDEMKLFVAQQGFEYKGFETTIPCATETAPPQYGTYQTLTTNDGTTTKTGAQQTQLVELFYERADGSAINDNDAIPHDALAGAITTFFQQSNYAEQVVRCDAMPQCYASVRNTVCTGLYLAQATSAQLVSIAGEFTCPPPATATPTASPTTPLPTAPTTAMPTTPADSSADSPTSSAVVNRMVATLLGGCGSFLLLATLVLL